MSFTTQVPAFAANIQNEAAAIRFTFRSGQQQVSASILADTHTRRPNFTRIGLRAQFNLMRDCQWHNETQRGHRIQRITSVTRPMRFLLNIQTFYQQDSTLDSAYGRGTTGADRSAGNTSLSFHESRHGALALNYINTHAVPVLSVQVGMTRIQLIQEMHRFNRELRHYNRTLEYLEIQEVDCVGVPMDERTCSRPAPVH